MNDILLAIFYGAVQGLTEFLPISSSGHLVLLHSIADLPIQNDLTFDVALHVGTLAAVATYFRADLLRLGRSWLASFRGQSSPDGRVAWWLIIATIPAGLLGLAFESTFETSVRNPVIVSAVLILGGVALWVVDSLARQQQTLESVDWKHSLAIGFGQAMALVPGVSRSGATIMVGRLVGLSREAAARFSFLLSIPIIAGAALKQLADISFDHISPAIILSGLAAAAVVGYLAIGWLMRYIQRASYRGFAIYRVLVGLAGLIWFGWLGR